MPTPRTAACLAMNSLSAVVIRTVTCLVCLQALEYDFAGMCLHLKVAIAAIATDLDELAAFVALSIASVARSKCSVSFRCLLPLVPGNHEVNTNENGSIMDGLANDYYNQKRKRNRKKKHRYIYQR